MSQRYRAYIDEVGHTGLSRSLDINSRYLTVTGVIFNISYIASDVAHMLDNLKRSHFPTHHPDSPVILHANSIKGKRWPFDSLKDPDVQAAFNNDLLSLINSLDFIIISITIDKNEFERRYPYWQYDHYHLCFYNFMERYYMFLQDNQALGDVMIESRKGGQDTPVKQLYKTIHQNGTDRIHRFYDRITSSELKVKPKIMNIPGLQIADLVSNPIRRFVLTEKYSEQLIPSSFCDSFFEILHPKIRKSSRGTIWGYGLKNL